MTKNKIQKISRISSLLLALFVLVSCNNNVVYREYHAFEENQWYAKDKAVFELDINDTQSLNTISLMVRHADGYMFSNIYLFVTTTYPDGNVKTDTMEVMLASSKGEWQGDGAGDIFDLKVPIKKNVRFPLSGHYKFEFTQAMQADPLPLIMDFGFEIKKSTAN
ncbi:MAG: gliding motility lipoprotein GldH [Bacteroidia bacterium]|jgi:gliding motility-associated lipoprotein GldH|nr:gliding motility lipoprotein GldH [Bacteroidia bacterium]